MSKRCRKVVESELRVSFDDVYQLVDSATVLNMLNKVSTRFKIYEGVRIGRRYVRLALDFMVAQILQIGSHEEEFPTSWDQTVRGAARHSCGYQWLNGV